MQHFNFPVLLVLFAGANALPFKDLLDGLNTTKPIWVKERSFTNNNTCVSVLMKNLTNTDYQFTQYYQSSGEKHNQTLYAKLGGGGEANPWMNVSQYQGGPGRKYTLEAWNKTQKCGVLTFQHLEGKFCEANFESIVDTIHMCYSKKQLKKATGTLNVRVRPLMSRTGTRGMTLCELHVWDENINGTVSECEKHYNNLCNISHTLYSNECKAQFP
ncbi:uncharacterized protein LOC142579944 isoform X2 [Dermacentor variabilis]|uniref:uncharacterized protein LOC142579944 isoform X2 n=1 Tax=Dermacentor variabilis TaxID=34621 RepID=UPI003F5C8480